MKKTIYSIKITNFDDHQRNLKRGHKAILLSTGFLSDHKIRLLTPAAKLLFLSCLLVAGESTSSQINVSHDSLCFQSGVKSGSLQYQLDLLQSLQLLSFEKYDLLNKVKEDKVKEDKVKEDKVKEDKVKEDKVSNDLKNLNNKKLKFAQKNMHQMVLLWNEHCNNLSEVLKSNKNRDGKIDSIWNELSADEWITVFKKTNDSLFCQNKAENSNGWKATFDWVLKKDSYLKVLEGKYDNRTNQRGFSNQRPDEDLSDLASIRGEIPTDGK